MKILQKMGSCLLVGFSFLLLAGCSPVKRDLPPENLPQAPNCAADGPGCKPGQKHELLINQSWLANLINKLAYFQLFADYAELARTNPTTP